MRNDLTVLVIETEFIIALGLQSALQAMGLSRVIVAANPADAQSRLEEWSAAALAIVELEADKPEHLEFARQLSQSGVAVIGLSVNSMLTDGVPELPGTPILIKPVPDADLAEAVRRRLDQYP
ncbi:response regulator [uncultured Devosia sp.]|uniref:response regulator n=1 Tax=uncultured Devosia sp. TaxID=211434 RepID=UPI00260719D6|nr:response regulator [uncultured Devosia sp.]